MDHKIFLRISNIIFLCSQAQLSDLQKKHCPDSGKLTDTQLVQSFLPERARTKLIASCANIVQAYPAVLKPYFFYLDVGQEVARVEIPAWIAQQPELVTGMLRPKY